MYLPNAFFVRTYIKDVETMCYQTYYSRGNMNKLRAVCYHDEMGNMLPDISKDETLMNKL